MYLGDGKIVQAPQPGEFVEVTTMWLSGYAGAVRVATGPATAVLPPVPVGVPGTGITPVGDAMPDGSPPPSPPPSADPPARVQHRSGASSQSGTSPGTAGTAPDQRAGHHHPGHDHPGHELPGTTSPGTTSPGTTSPGTTAPGTTSPGSSASGDSGSPTGSHEPERLGVRHRRSGHLLGRARPDHAAGGPDEQRAQQHAAAATDHAGATQHDPAAARAVPVRRRVRRLGRAGDHHLGAAGAERLAVQPDPVADLIRAGQGADARRLRSQRDRRLDRCLA